jgi:hypothetical protein
MNDPKTARHVHLIGATGQIRTGKYHGDDVLIVPVVALMEGVIRAVNAPSAELVPFSSIMVAPQGWAGRPVVLDHPIENGRQVSANSPRILEERAFGTIFNPRTEGRKLLMEAWLDPVRAARVAPAVLRRLSSGDMIEVSVGVFVVAEDRQGEFKGKRFNAIWRDIVPDHLAFLSEGDTGACSIAMGCGSPRAASAYLINGDELEERTLGGAGSGWFSSNGHVPEGGKNTKAINHINKAVAEYGAQKKFPEGSSDEVREHYEAVKSHLASSGFSPTNEKGYSHSSTQSIDLVHPEKGTFSLARMYMGVIPGDAARGYRGNHYVRLKHAASRHAGGPGSGVVGHTTGGDGPSSSREAEKLLDKILGGPAGSRAVRKKANIDKLRSVSTTDLQKLSSAYTVIERESGQKSFAHDRVRAELKVRTAGGPGSGVKGHTTDHGKPIQSYHSNSGSAFVHKVNYDDPMRPAGTTHVVKTVDQDKKAGQTYHKSEADATKAANEHIHKPLTGHAGIIDRVESNLREDGYSIHQIPVDRLKAEIAYAAKHGDGDVTVKIPSRSEISMSVEHAQAVLKEITKHERGRGRFGANPEGHNQYTHGDAARVHSSAARAHEIASRTKTQDASKKASALSKKADDITTALNPHDDVLFKSMDAVQEAKTASHYMYRQGFTNTAVTAHELASMFHKEAAGGHTKLARKNVSGTTSRTAGAFQENAEVLIPGTSVRINLPGNVFHGETGSVQTVYGNLCRVARPSGQNLGTFPMSTLRVTHLRTTGGPGSGRRGHTTDRSKTGETKLSLDAADHDAIHEALNNYHDLLEDDSADAGNKEEIAAIAAIREKIKIGHVSLTKSESDFVQSALHDYHKGMRDDADDEDIKPAYDANKKVMQKFRGAASLRAAGGPGSGIKGHITNHDAAASAHDKAASAHQKALDRLKKMTPAERKQAEEDDISPGSEDRIGAEELSKDALAASKSAVPHPSEDASTSYDVAAFEAHGHAHDAAAAASDSVYDLSGEYSREARDSHKKAAEEHRIHNRELTKKGRSAVTFRDAANRLLPTGIVETEEYDRIPEAGKKLPTGDDATKRACREAEKASHAVNASPTRSGHRLAARLHSKAADHHESFGNKNQESYHRRMADHHATVAAARTAEAREAVNPTGINQYTKGGSGTAKVHETAAKAHEAAAAAHEEAAKNPSVDAAIAASGASLAAHESTRGVAKETHGKKYTEHEKLASDAFHKAMEARSEIEGRKAMIVSTRNSITGETTPEREIRPATKPNAEGATRVHKEAAAAHRAVAESHRKKSTPRSASNPEGINQYTHGGGPGSGRGGAIDLGDRVKVNIPGHKLHGQTAKVVRSHHVPMKIGTHTIQFKNKSAAIVHEKNLNMHLRKYREPRDMDALEKRHPDRPKFVRSTGGPGSGQRGHTTAHDAASVAHDKAKKAHDVFTAGWADGSTKTYDSLDEVHAAHPEVFKKGMSHGESIKRVREVNQEGNYHDFVLKRDKAGSKDPVDVKVEPADHEAVSSIMDSFSEAIGEMPEDYSDGDVEVFGKAVEAFKKVKGGGTLSAHEAVAVKTALRQVEDDLDVDDNADTLAAIGRVKKALRGAEMNDLAIRGASARMDGPSRSVISVGSLGDETHVLYGDGQIAVFDRDAPDLTPNIRNAAFVGFVLRASGGPGSGVRGHTTPQDHANKSVTLHEKAAQAHRDAAEGKGTKKEALLATKEAVKFSGDVNDASSRAYASAHNAYHSGTEEGKKSAHSYAAKAHDDVAQQHRDRLVRLRGAGGPGSGIVGHRSVGGRMPKETAHQKRGHNPTDKDAKRISDIVKKSGGNREKAHDLAYQMANAIKDGPKAKRRAYAAEDAGHSSIAEIFHERHDQLTRRAATVFAEGTRVQIGLVGSPFLNHEAIVRRSALGLSAVEFPGGSASIVFPNSALRASR